MLMVEIERKRGMLYTENNFLFVNMKIDNIKDIHSLALSSNTTFHFFSFPPYSICIPYIFLASSFLRALQPKYFPYHFPTPHTPHSSIFSPIIGLFIVFSTQIVSLCSFFDFLILYKIELVFISAYSG